MDRSPYLVQALQALSAAPQAAPTPRLDPQQVATYARQARAWQTQNPGESYLGHNLMQAGRNVAAVPGQVGNGLGALAQMLGVGGGDSLAGLY